MVVHEYSADSQPDVQMPNRGGAHNSGFAARLNLQGQRPQTDEGRVMALSKRLGWFPHYSCTLDQAIRLLRPMSDQAIDVQPVAATDSKDDRDLVDVRANLFWRQDGGKRAEWALMAAAERRAHAASVPVSGGASSCLRAVG